MKKAFWFGIFCFVLGESRVLAETQLKYIISESEYKILMDYYGKNPIAEQYVQKNYYFDTKDLFMKKNGASLRVRLNKIGHSLNLKIDSVGTGILKKNLSNNPVFERDEYDCEFAEQSKLPEDLIAGKKTIDSVTEADCKNSINTTLHPVKALDLFIEAIKKRYKKGVISASAKRMQSLASNETARMEITLSIAGGSVPMTVDRTVFPDKYFGYEVEFDLKGKTDGEKYKAEIEKLLKTKHNCQIRPSQYSKSTLTFLIIGKQHSKLSEILKGSTLFK